MSPEVTNLLTLLGLGLLGWVTIVLVSFLFLLRLSHRAHLAHLVVWLLFNSLTGVAANVLIAFGTNHHPIPWALATIVGIPVWWFIFCFARDFFRRY